MKHILPAMLLALVLILKVQAQETPANTLSWSQTKPFDSALMTMSLHTAGNKILNGSNQPVRLHGVNIASLEWRNEGEHIEESVGRAINDWKVNIIRLPLAQDRWFGKMPNQTNGGAAYRAIVDRVVELCAASRCYLMLELHWSDCGKWSDEGGQLGQHNMPDKNSVLFWQELATRFKNHPHIIFGLYNEPHDTTFAIWRDGGSVTDKPADWNPSRTSVVFEAVGIQKLYDTVRATGATNVVTASGLDWGFDLRGVLKGFEIKGENLVYETHPYPFKSADWDKNFGAVSEKFPVLIGEWGFEGRRLTDNSTNLVYARKLMDYARKREMSWIAWDLHTGAAPTLIKNWQYEPTVFGQFTKDELAAEAVERATKLAK